MFLTYGKLCCPITAGASTAPRDAPPQSGPCPPPLLLPPLTQLTAGVPHLLGAVVGRVHPQPQRVDTGQVAGIVPDEAVPWGRGGVGLWWLLGYHSLTGCRSLSATFPPTSRDQLGTGRTPIAGSCFPLSSLSDEGAGGPHEEAPEVQRGTGTPSRSLAPHPSRSPHIPGSVGGAPGPRLQSFIAQPTNTPPAPPRVPGTLPCMSHLQALGQPASPVWKSPPPLHLAASSPCCRTPPASVRPSGSPPHRSYPSVSGPGLGCEPVKADSSPPCPSALFLHVYLARCWALIP